MNTPDTISTISATTTKRTDAHALVTRVPNSVVKKIDDIAATLGITRSEATKKLLELSFVALEVTIPEVIADLDIHIESARALRRAQDSVKARFDKVSG